MTYEQTLDTLYAMLPDFQTQGAAAYKPGLERITAFNDYLGQPDKSFLTIHVAGTNGKGSVSHMLASVLTAAGYRTGLYTSPHIKDFTERIRIDGKMISRQAVVQFAEANMDMMRRLGLSFFEATVAMALDYFRARSVDIAIIETGLGGRLDATNIITPVVSVITNIGLEHTSLLGDTIEKIAREKGGIIKPGVPVVTGKTDGESSAVFSGTARDRGAQLFPAGEHFMVVREQEEAGRSALYRATDLSAGESFILETDLLGHYQSENIATILTTLCVLSQQGKIKISRQNILDGLSRTAHSTGLRGRWQILRRSPLVVCDTGHNAHALAHVATQVHSGNYQRLFMVIGVAGDKDLDAIVPLLPPQGYYFFTRPSNPRGQDASLLYREAIAAGLNGEVCPSVEEAVKKALSLANANDMVFIGGSNFTVADIPDELWQCGCSL